MKRLPDKIRETVYETKSRGDEFEEKGDYRRALDLYKQAWGMIPEPKADWFPSDSLLPAIGRVHFFCGDFKKAKECLIESLKIDKHRSSARFTLGQTLVELGETEQGVEEMFNAYKKLGLILLDGIDSKYLDLLKSNRPRPVGGWEGELFEFEEWIDVDSLRGQLTNAIKTYFTELREAVDGDRIYAFVLYTVDDLVGIQPSAATEESYARAKTEDDEDPDEEERINFRWSPYDWEYECEFQEHFDEISDSLYKAVEKIEDSNHPNALEQLTADVLSTLVLSLHDAKQKQLLGDVPGLMLFCSKPDSFDTHWLERDSARLLNSPEQFKIFEKERLSEMIDEGAEELKDVTYMRFQKRLRHSGLFPGY